jgi:hypothetical protein
MTDAVQRLSDLRSAGLHFAIEAGCLAVWPRDLITREIRNAIQAHRAAIVRLVLEEARGDLEERAAILEFDGGHSRDEAERLALAEFGFQNWEQLDGLQAGRAAA